MPNFWFNYERPNPYLYKFSGFFFYCHGIFVLMNLFIKGNMILENEEKVPLDQQNFILRGSNLRNTGWITGVVAYTGFNEKS